MCVAVTVAFWLSAVPSLATSWVPGFLATKDGRTLRDVLAKGFLTHPLPGPRSASTRLPAPLPVASTDVTPKLGKVIYLGTYTKSSYVYTVVRRTTQVHSRVFSRDS